MAPRARMKECRKINSKVVLLFLFLLVATAVDRVVGQTVVSDGLSNFEVVPVLQDIGKVTDFAWTPDHKRLITISKEGAVNVYNGETFAKLQTPALDLSDVLCADKGAGGYSVTVHPNFDGKDNQYIYIFYVRKGSAGCPGSIDGKVPHPDGAVSRLSRFVLPPSNIIDLSSEEIMIETGPVAEKHFGGHVAFGNDGYMYVTTGDAGHSTSSGPNVASHPDNLHGKILRITDDGDVPSDNPYVSISNNKITSIRCNDRRVPSEDEKTAVRCQEVFSSGFRNPFNIAMDPTTTSGVRFLINDVGGSHWEEVSEGGTGYETKHYGWYKREGPCLTRKSESKHCIPDERFIDPIYWWNHPEEGSTSVTGGVFVPAEAGWPEYFTGEYLVSDAQNTKISHLKHQPSRACRGQDCALQVPEYKEEPIIEDIPGGVLRMYFGLFEEVSTLFFLSYYDRALYRLSPIEGSNRRPTAAIDQFLSSSSVGSALTVQFNGMRSFDPDGDSLSYEWNFGEDGSLPSNEAVALYTYSNPGQYAVTLTVTDGNGGSAVESVDVNVPQRTISDSMGSLPVFPWKTGDACPPGYDFCGVLEFCKDGSTYGYRLPCQEKCTAAQTPVIRLRPGKKYKLTLSNVAPEGIRTNIHPHGLHVAGSGDADDVTRSVTAGNCLDYTWDILPDHPGGTYWYHPHPHGVSEEQVKGGAFGLLIIEDNAHPSPPLASSVQEGANNNDIPEWASNELLLQIAHIDGVVWGNGKHYEVMNVSANQWYRLRVSVVDPLGEPLLLRFTSGCEVHKVASDGVWHSSIPGPSADTFELTGASRADFAIKCTDPEGSTVNMLYDDKVVAIVNIEGEEPNPFLLLPWDPKRPAALQNIASASVPDENRFNVTIQRETLNYLEWNPDVPLKTIAFDQVHEWEIANSTKHPFHMHLYHMLVVTPGGCGAHQEGEFYDTIAGPTCRVRFRTADIGQRCVFHCHVMEHSDLGAVGWVDVQGQGMPVNNVVSPEYKCPSYCHSSPPKPKPTPKPKPKPSPESTTSTSQPNPAATTSSPTTEPGVSFWENSKADAKIASTFVRYSITLTCAFWLLMGCY